MKLRPALLLALIAAALLAQELSFGLNVQDDAFISYRYARNLSEGHGLVFNLGEPVEGFTNFLWTVGLAGVIAAGGDPLWASVWGGILASLVMLWALWAIGRPVVGDRAALVAPALLAVNAPFALEAVQGLETAAFAALGVVALGLMLREVEDPRRFPWSCVVLGVAALTRPEGILLFGLLHGARLLGDRPADRAAWRRLGLGWAAFAGIVGALFAFRLAYYGQPLPNTFYAKTGGGSAQWLRGVAYIAGFVADHPALCALALLGAGLAATRVQQARERLLLAITLGYGGYIVAVGGDFKVTWRFIAPFLGPLCLLAQDGLVWTTRSLAARSRPLAAGVVGLAALAVLGSAIPSYRSMLAEARFRAQVMEDRLAVGRALARLFPPDAVLAIHSAGTIPYAAGLRTLDMWGLSDPYIARKPVEDMGAGMAGHEKFDYPYVFGKRPDLYVPEQDYLTDAPVKLAKVGVDAFLENYEQRSLPLGERWLNLFVLVEAPPAPAP
ncbi:MAG: glycosyltransferase family 39 protein [Alphaproteobacteria bacterium]|nr:glycosyltransferase family 39 protein [Alphaproteobacteria bacterium]